MKIINVPGGRLRVDAAESYMRARKDGLPAGITSSYRDPVRQQYLRDGWLARKPGFNFALAPENSNHCKGIAVDLPGHINNVKTPRGWMRKNGKQYGFYPVSNEPWHFDYYSTRDEKRHITRDDTQHVTEDNTEDDMEDRIYQSRTTGGQKLKKGVWNAIKVTDKGGVSTVWGADQFEVTVKLELKVPTDTQLRARYFKYNMKTKKRGYVYDVESKVDSPRATGSTLMFDFSLAGDCGPDERIRAEVYTWTDKAEITAASSRATIRKA